MFYTVVENVDAVGSVKWFLLKFMFYISISSWNLFSVKKINK